MNSSNFRIKGSPQLARSDVSIFIRLADNCQTLTVIGDDCQRGQLSEGTTVRGDNCQRGQLSEDQLSVGHGQLSEETVRAFLALGQL